jgi:predicted transcriptional regulator
LKKLKPCLHQAEKAISNAEANGVDAAMLMTPKACVAKLKKLVEECTLVKHDSSKYKLSSGYTKMKDFITEINVANKAVGMLNVMSQS